MDKSNSLKIRVKGLFDMKAPASPFIRFGAGVILLAVAFFIVVRAIAPNGLM